MIRRVLTLTALSAFILSVPAVASAQSVELLFTPGATQEAVALKDSLKVDHIAASNAFALVGAPRQQQEAFAAKMSGLTAIVIVGDDALKATSHLAFTVPLIIVNSTGPTEAKGKVLRVFDPGSAPPTAVDLPAADALGSLISSGKPVSLKGDPKAIVQALLTALK